MVFAGDLNYRIDKSVLDKEVYYLLRTDPKRLRSLCQLDAERAAMRVFQHGFVRFAQRRHFDVALEVRPGFRDCACRVRLCGLSGLWTKYIESSYFRSGSSHDHPSVMTGYVPETIFCDF